MLTLALIASLIVQPSLTLHILWDMVIPLLPAVFLVNPMLWRNMCPLATLNSFTGVRAGTRVLGARTTRAAWALGIILLIAMVPARRFLFNTNGPALAITIVGVALVAVLAGLIVSRRGGFCNALCPVLPVEKLYGQLPLLEVGNPRCADCSLCTTSGCIDLASTKTVVQTIGPARRGVGWLRTSFGAFAAAFPGFIIGYFAVTNGDLSTAPLVYADVLGCAAASYIIVACITVVGNVSAKVMVPVLGGLAFLFYYWFAAPGLGKAYGVPDVGPVVIRAAAVSLLTIWAWQGWARRALRRAA